MENEISLNTKAILLLTAPLLTGTRHTDGLRPLTPGEYNEFAAFLYRNNKQPEDLFSHDSEILNLYKNESQIDIERIRLLLNRGMLLAAALSTWQARSIWVVSRADRHYPQKFRKLLLNKAPAVIYGCGDNSLLDAGGLAIVGSRNVNNDLLGYAQNFGRLAALAGHNVISGGARGIDSSAIHGALDVEGTACAVLADGLAEKVLNKNFRNPIRENRLCLVSPYDPFSGFNVGNAMQRNKLVYALSDAALIVNSDKGKGGTWNGAVEQLKKYHFSRIYVRSSGDNQEALLSLQELGADKWPEPASEDDFNKIIKNQNNNNNVSDNDFSGKSESQSAQVLHNDNELIAQTESPDSQLNKDDTADLNGNSTSMVVNGENADSSDESAKTDVQNIDDSIIFRLVNDIKNINNNQEKSGRKITVKHYDLNNNEVITDMTGLDYEEKINQFIKIILEDLLTKKPLTFTEICNETGIYQSKAKKLIERFIDEEFIERYTDKKSTYFRLRRHDFID